MLAIHALVKSTHRLFLLFIEDNGQIIEEVLCKITLFWPECRIVPISTLLYSWLRRELPAAGMRRYISEGGGMRRLSTIGITPISG